MSEPVLIIAEAGVNHDGSLDDACRMIDVAAEAGADVVKFQTFVPEAVLTARAMKAAYQETNTGEGGTQLDMVRKLALSRDDHRVLADRCDRRGVRFMSTAFDMESLDFLSGLDMPAIKIPSGDLTWGAMLLAAARVGPPLIVSTGMATLDEVRQALTVIAFGLTRDGDPVGPDDLEQAFADGQAALRERVTLLHCTTEYPAPLEAINLRAMTTMAETFNLKVGYSDHSLGQTVAVAGVALVRDPTIPPRWSRTNWPPWRGRSARWRSPWAVRKNGPLRPSGAIWGSPGAPWSRRARSGRGNA
jgi:N-acetylneuraminate synthase